MGTAKGLCSLLIVGAFVSVACGDSKSSLNPVAPSAVVLDGSQSAESGAIVGPQGKGGVPGPPADKGNGNGNDNGNGNGNDGKNPNNGSNPGPGGGQTPANDSPGAPTTKKVQIEGLIGAKGTDSITVNGQKVVVPPTCPIRHGSTSFTFADLHTGDRVHVTANKVSSSPAVTMLEATEVKLQNPGDPVESGEIGAGEPTNLISVTATDALAGETGGDTGLFTLTRSGGATSMAASLSVTFTLTGTATNGADYTSLPLTANFAAGVATTTVVVNPAADDVFGEGAETVILTLGVTTPYEPGSPASATVTIADTAEPPKFVSVSATDAQADEVGGDTGAFTLTRSGSAQALAAPLSVTFTLTGTATNGADYTSLPLTANFAAGAATTTVIVNPAADDIFNEGAETVVLTLGVTTPYELGSPASATVTIADTPEPPKFVSVSATDAQAGETGADSGTFTLTRSGSAQALAAPLSVTFTLTGTATNGADYASLPLNANFAAGAATTTVVVNPTGDALREGPETVTLTLDVTAPYEVGSPASATVTIADTPLPMVSVTAVDAAAAERGLDPGTFRFTRNDVAATPLTVTYTITGTATNGTDYVLLTGSVIIPANVSFVDVRVTPKADIFLNEITETVIVTLVDGVDYDLGSPSTATVNIAP